MRVDEVRHHVDRETLTGVSQEHVGGVRPRGADDGIQTTPLVGKHGMIVWAQTSATLARYVSKS
jgi:hypothetical protein